MQLLTPAAGYDNNIILIITRRRSSVVGSVRRRRLESARQKIRFCFPKRLFARTHAHICRRTFYYFFRRLTRSLIISIRPFHTQFFLTIFLFSPRVIFYAFTSGPSALVAVVAVAVFILDRHTLLSLWPPAVRIETR